MRKPLAQPLHAAASRRRGLALCLLLVAGLLLTGGCASKKAAAPDQAAAFWPPYPDEPRLQFLVSYQRSTDIEPPKSGFDQLVYGKEAEESLPLAKPYGVEMHDGRIYVCDLRNACLTVLDLRNRRTLVIGQTGASTLQRPTDLAIAADGKKYVADIGRGFVFVFDEQERHIGNIGHKDLKPVGVAVYQDELFVCDFQSQRVEVYDRHSGAMLRTIGQPGSGDGEFIRPLGIAVDNEGYVYVTDVLRCKMQKFDRQGNLVTNFGIISANAGGMVRPKHIDVDQDGIIYVVDAAFQNVQLFDQNGQVLTYFGSAGSHPGAMYLPAGISVHDADLELFKQYIHPAFEAQRLILVSNQFGDNKISVYALGHLKQGLTVADVSASKGLVPSGTTDATPAGPRPTTLPAPTDDTDTLADTLSSESSR